MSGAAENLVKCHHSYEAQQEDELTLSINDIIQVEEYHDDSWWLGKNLTTEKSGLFPSNFVMPLSTHSVSIPRDAERVQAAFDYEPQAPDELTLKKGDIVTVISKDDGWWSGELAGKIGLFPANFVVPYNPQATEKATSFSKYNTAPAQTSNAEDSSDPPKRTSFSDNFKLAAYGVKKGGIGSLFSGAKSLKGRSKTSTRNSQASDAENTSPIPSPRQSIASIPEEIPDITPLNNSSIQPPTRLPNNNEPSNPPSETLKDSHTSPQSKLPPIPNTNSLPSSPPQTNLPQPPTKTDIKPQSDMPPIPLPAIPSQSSSAPLRTDNFSSKSEVGSLNEDSQDIETKEDVAKEQKPDDEIQSLEESENDTPKGPGFKLAAYGVKKGGIGGLMATGGMPQLRKVNTGNPLPASNSKASSAPSIPRLLSSPEIPSAAKDSEKQEKILPSKSEENISSNVPEVKAPDNIPETFSDDDTPLQEGLDQNLSSVIKAFPLAEEQPTISAKNLDTKVNLTEPLADNSIVKEESDDFSDIIAAVTKVADSYSTPVPKAEPTEKDITSTVPVNEGKKEANIYEDGSDSDTMGQDPSATDKDSMIIGTESTAIPGPNASALQENSEYQDDKSDDKNDSIHSGLPSAPSESDIIPVPESHQATSINEQETEKEPETIQPSPLQARLALKLDSSPLASDAVISGPRGKRPASRKPRGVTSDDKKPQLTQSEALENAIKQDFEEAKKIQEENPEKAGETNLKSNSIGKVNKIATPFAGLTGPPKLPNKPVLARFQNLNSESAENVSAQNTNINQEDQRPRGRFTGARSSFAEQLERSAAANTTPAPVNSLQERLKTFVREEIDKVQKEFESQLEAERQARSALEQEIIALKARLAEFTSNDN